ncbi:MAG: Ig-like domain-containing protein [Lachnospiraceae bacterium]|nr:Ig-like domain-containing protein [Lachnospiraceae bacterium]
MKNSSTKAMAMFLSLAMVASMTPGVTVEAAKAKAKLNKKKATIYVGKTVKLKVKNVKGKVKWKSSNKKVAKVSKKGLVKGIKPGKATITAKVGKKKYKCKVRVKWLPTGLNTNTTVANTTTPEQQTTTTQATTTKATVATTQAATTQPVTTAENSTTAEEETAGEIITTKQEESTSAGEVTSSESQTTEIITTSHEETTTVKETVEETTTVEEPTTVSLNAKDVAGLTEIIKYQKSKGASVSEDLKSDQYVWDKDGNLTGINWSDVRLKGDLNFNDNSNDGACVFESIKTIDISQNPDAYKLTLNNSKTLLRINLDKSIGFRNIDLSGNTELLEVRADYMNNLVRALFNGCTKIESIQLYGADCLAQLEVYGCDNLWGLGVDSQLIADIDTSQNPKLVVLVIQDSYFLRYIDITQNRFIERLNTDDSCGETGLKTIDLSNNFRLQELGCYRCGLEKLDLSKNVELREIRCQYNKLTELDLSKCKLLSKVDLDGNPLAKSNKINLFEIKNNIKNIINNNNDYRDLIENAAVTEAVPEESDSSSVQYNEADVEGLETIIDNFDNDNNTVSRDWSSDQYEWDENGRLKKINWSNAGLEGECFIIGEDDSAKFSELEEVDLSYNENLDSMSVCYCPKVKKVDFTGCLKVRAMALCGNDNLEYIEADNLILMEECNIEDNNSLEVVSLKNSYYLEQFSLNNCENVKSLAVTNSLLEELPVLDNLEYLDFHNSNISSLETGNSNLKYLNCRNNKLTALNLGKMSELDFLDCRGNVIEELNFAANKNLVTINCSNNNLKALDVSGNSKLEKLYCLNNQISELNMEQCDMLKELDCSSNNLKNLVFASPENLELLDCSGNKFTELELGEKAYFKDLIFLDFSDNEISIFNKYDLFADSPEFLSVLNCSNNNLSELDIEEIALVYLNCRGNNINNINVRYSEFTRYLVCDENNIEELEVPFPESRFDLLLHDDSTTVTIFRDGN